MQQGCSEALGPTPLHRHSPRTSRLPRTNCRSWEMALVGSHLARRLPMFLPAQGWGGAVQGSQSLGSHPSSSMYSTATGGSEADAGAAQGPPASTGDARVSGCLTWHSARSSCSKGAERVPILGLTEPHTHVCRAALGQQLQGAQEEARTAGQRLAAQAVVRPSYTHFEIWRIGVL